MFVHDRGDGGGGSQEDGGGFVRRAYLFALALGLVLYGSLAVVIVHDMALAPSPTETWAGEIFVRQGWLGLLFSSVLFFPGVALYFLSRWFASRD